MIPLLDRMRLARELACDFDLPPPSLADLLTLATDPSNAALFDAAVVRERAAKLGSKQLEIRGRLDGASAALRANATSGVLILAAAEDYGAPSVAVEWVDGAAVTVLGPLELPVGTPRADAIAAALAHIGRDAAWLREALGVDIVAGVVGP